MFNWMKRKSKVLFNKNLMIQSDVPNDRIGVIPEKKVVAPAIIEATNEYKRDLKKDFENFTDFMHQQMMRITIINLENAQNIDIEQLKMEQLKALRLKRVG